MKQCSYTGPSIVLEKMVEEDSKDNTPKHVLVAEQPSEEKLKSVKVWMGLETPYLGHDFRDIGESKG